MKGLLQKIFSRKRTPSGFYQSRSAEPKIIEVPNNRFLVAASRVSDSPFYRPASDSRNPYGFFHNRPVIGECTRIHGGIYISPFPAEALVVDEKYDLLRPIASSFRVRFGGLQEYAIERELEILEDIFNLSNKAFDWSIEKITNFNRLNGIHCDSKVALDVYIRERIGSSRHRVLLAAYLIEKLKEDGHLTGNHSITSTMTTEDGNDERLIYTFRNGAFATYDPRPEHEGRIFTTSSSTEGGSLRATINQ